MISARPVAQTIEPDAPARYAQQVNAQALEHLFRSLPRVAGTVLVPIAMVWIMWQRLDHAIVLAWGLAIFLISAVTQSIPAFYFRHPRSTDEVPRWGRYFTLALLANGLAWGAASMLFFVPGSTALQVFLFTAIIGMCAGSISILSYWLPSYYAFIVPPLVFAALRLFLEGSMEYQVLAGLVIMTLVILLLLGHSVKKSALAAIRLGFENLDLVQQLQIEKNRAEDANLAKSKFLAAASHDLRQPLHALSLFTATLNEKIRQPDARDLLDNIKLSVNALENLFNALLDVSRLDAGVIQPRISSSNLQPLFNHLSNEYAPQAHNNGLTWNMHCDDIAAHTDPVLLETILRNLISNAIRYTPSGNIQLRCAAQHSDVTIDIQDTGIGISDAHQQEIFNEFVQLQNPERDRNKGLGLGLAIVKRLSHLLDHKLTLHSEPGTGTTFSLTLPLATLQTRGLPHVDDNAHSPGLRVLVIDDEVAVLKAVEALLSEWGYEVIVADSAQAALNSLQTAPDVIIADYRLRQNLTGIEAIRAVHTHWGNHIPALIITGDTGPEQLREASQSGYSLLHKPVQPGRLRAFLRQAALAADRIAES
jgi:signal transduction histidine kinase/CheY-like chemotaxis protein